MKSDLVVVVADGGIEQAVRGVLARHQSIGIRPLRGVEFPKLHKLDEGAYSSGHEIASLYRDTHEHAMIIFDFAWEGRPRNNPADMIRDVENKLRPTWGDKGRCVVIDPELEVWVWSDSPHVASALGWRTMPELRGWLESNHVWKQDEIKPGDPKAAYELAIREKKVQKSNATFRHLAEKVSLRRCSDPSFLMLLQILGSWFPVSQVGIPE